MRGPTYIRHRHEEILLFIDTTQLAAAAGAATDISKKFDPFFFFFFFHLTRFVNKCKHEKDVCLVADPGFLRSYLATDGGPRTVT